MPPINADANFPMIFWESLKNEPHEAASIATTPGQKIRTNLRFGIGDLNSLWICIGTPRNEIDNPVTYCTQPFYTRFLTFVASSININIFKDYQFASEKKFLSHLLWNTSIQLGEKLEERTQKYQNSPKDFWKWFSHGKVPVAEYYALAYIMGGISAEKAIEMSGLDEMEFAVKVREAAQERDLPIFRAYLKGEAIEVQLPFSEEASQKFRDLMAEEME